MSAAFAIVWTKRTSAQMLLVDEQIERFIKNWFRKEPTVGEECWEKIKADSALKELATIPHKGDAHCIAHIQRHTVKLGTYSTYKRQ